MNGFLQGSNCKVPFDGHSMTSIGSGAHGPLQAEEPIARIAAVAKDANGGTANRRNRHASGSSRSFCRAFDEPAARAIGKHGSGCPCGVCDSLNAQLAILCIVFSPDILVITVSVIEVITMTRCIPQWLSPVVEAPSSPGSALRNRPGTVGVRPVEPPTIGIRKDPKTLGVYGGHPYTVFVIACR